MIHQLIRSSRLSSFIGFTHEWLNLQTVSKHLTLVTYEQQIMAQEQSTCGLKWRWTKSMKLTKSTEKRIIISSFRIYTWGKLWEHSPPGELWIRPAMPLRAQCRYEQPGLHLNAKAYSRFWQPIDVIPPAISIPSSPIIFTSSIWFTVCYAPNMYMHD